MPIKTVTNQFSEAAVEKPVEIPVETVRIARKRAVAVRIAPSPVRRNKPLCINVLGAHEGTRPADATALEERSFFFHTDKSFWRLHLTRS